MEFLKPILLSGGGRTGSTQIMSSLGSDPRVAFDREFPYESRYLTYFAKLDLLLQRPDLLKFFQPQQLFELNHLGFGGYMPGTDYVPDFSPFVYLPRAEPGSWLRTAWHKFSCDVWQTNPEGELYAEKSPVWLPPMLRQYMDVFTLYNVRDPRDIFLSANAFMKKSNAQGFARAPGATDRDHARRVAQAFLNTFDNYYMDRNREDTLLLRYEDYVSDRPKVLENISRLTGVEVKSGNEFFNSNHATTKDLGGSVQRWKREPLPPDVLSLLQELLHEEMTALGYEFSSAAGSVSSRTISFAEGRTKLSKIDHSSDGILEQASDYAVVNVRGPDFHIFLPFEAFEAAEVREVWASLSGGVGNICSLYWRRRDAGFDETCSLHVPYMPAPHWAMVTFPVHTHPEWRGTITHLRLDLFNSHLPPNRGIGGIRWVRLVS